MSRTRTKLCGMMSAQDALAAVHAGADAIGMILHAETKRLINLETAESIVKSLPPYIAAVGVFVDDEPNHIKDVAKKLHLAAVQLQGNETCKEIKALGAHKVIKAIKVDPEHVRTTLEDWRRYFADGLCPNLTGIMLESHVPGQAGGTGVANDYALIKKLIDEGAFKGLPPIIIAGGLSPENVGDVVKLLNPYAVDVASGIESTYGKKSVEKMNAFVKNASL